MRSALVFLALSLPSAAFASPTYSSPLRTWAAQQQSPKPQRVAVEFFNSMPKPCDLHLNGEVVAVPAFRSVRLRVPLEASVTVSSQFDSRLVGEVLRAAVASDNGRMVIVH